MSNALLHVDSFGVAVPAPNEPFTSTIIHPRNLAIQERQVNARRLTRSELVSISKEMQSLRALLNEVKYYDQFEEYKALKQRYKLYVAEHERATDAEVKAEKADLLGQVRAKGLAVSQALLPLQPRALRYQMLADMLEDHQLAVERYRMHVDLNKLMAKEAKEWKQRLIETLTRLGYCWEHQDKKGRYVVDQIAFSEVVVTPDAVWFKIEASQKTFFGTRNVLPKRVHVADLVDEKTLYELSIACQRQVTAEVSYVNGAWYKVNRLGTTDGLLNYVTLEQVLNSYPHDQRASMPIPIGVGEGRNISWIMLAEHPHFLVGGSTGNGKSNVTHDILCSLIQFQSPTELRLCLIDLKDGAEFAPYADIPHLIMPIVRKPEEAINVLSQMEALRGQRMELISAAKCTNILEYNERYPDKAMPRMVIFVDEYARLKARGAELEALADRSSGEITALGRASGVHFFAATQTPYASVLPGETKNNMTVRIALAMQTLEASRAILGNGDALKLPQETKGRAILGIGSMQIQVQIPFVRGEDKLKAIQSAMDWGDAPTLLLPETIHVDVFDQHELLDIAINELGGNLGARTIFDYVKGDRQTTLSEVREMVKKLWTTQKEIEFDGTVYDIRKRGMGWRLFAQSHDNTIFEDTPTEVIAVQSSAQQASAAGFNLQNEESVQSNPGDIPASESLTEEFA